MSCFPVIGMMSGTSMDGIDTTLVFTDGINIKKTGIFIHKKYSSTTLSLLKKAVNTPYKYINNQKLIDLVTLEHYFTIKDLQKKTSIKPSLIGFHGQTILHDINKKKSIQIGNPKLLSNLTKIDVVFDFRKKDILYNGQGAPLAPIYHRYIIENENFKTPCCIINIGGVTNLTYWDKEKLIGFDCGPGNGLLDMFAQEKLGIPFDNFGDIASQGRTNKFLVTKFLNNEYFKKKYPKSLDRKSFDKEYKKIIISKMSNQDKLATFVDITAHSIFKSLDILPTYPKYVLICGGGQFNKFLVKKIKSGVKCLINTADEIKLNGSLIEAELIAFLAMRRLKNYPTTLPSTTGVDKPISGGEIYSYT